MVPESPWVDLKIELLQFSSKCKETVEGGVIREKMTSDGVVPRAKTSGSMELQKLGYRQTFIPFKLATDCPLKC